MKRLLVLLGVLLTVAASAQAPSPYNLSGKAYPQVNPDKTVTFQFNAPSASKVIVNLGKDYEMTKNEKGVWEVTTDPQVEGFHYYSIKVGGLSSTDPSTYTFIDEYSRFRYLEAFPEHSTFSSAEFIKHCVQRFPYAIECVQTDNGFEFTNSKNSHGTDRETLFEKTLRELGIRHKLIRVCTPRHNGKVERSHRKDNEEFYASHRFYSFDDFRKQLAVRERAYNHFPIRPLNWRSPIQVLSSFGSF